MDSVFLYFIRGYQSTSLHPKCNVFIRESSIDERVNQKAMIFQTLKIQCPTPIFSNYEVDDEHQEHQGFNDETLDIHQTTLGYYINDMNNQIIEDLCKIGPLVRDYREFAIHISLSFFVLIYEKTRQGNIFCCTLNHNHTVLRVPLWNWSYWFAILLPRDYVQSILSDDKYDFRRECQVLGLYDRHVSRLINNNYITRAYILKNKTASFMHFEIIQINKTFREEPYELYLEYIYKKQSFTVFGMRPSMGCQMRISDLVKSNVLREQNIIDLKNSIWLMHYFPWDLFRLIQNFII